MIFWYKKKKVQEDTRNDGIENITDLPGLEELKSAGLLESRLPSNLDIKIPEEIDETQIDPLAEDDNLEDMIASNIDET